MNSGVCAFYSFKENDLHAFIEVTVVTQPHVIVYKDDAVSRNNSKFCNMEHNVMQTNEKDTP